MPENKPREIPLSEIAAVSPEAVQVIERLRELTESYKKKNEERCKDGQ